MLGIEPSWLLAGLVVVHLLTLGYAYWRRSEAEGATGTRHEALEALDSPAPEVEFDDDTPTVDCEVCGAENAAEYAFCRGCASELPGGPAGDEAPTAAFGSGSV
ncbi:zinc ribbon domain-containing protein [Salinirubellus salinus]|uniref:Zinc ribbon domain-containing protein n=1 Tax=Salinirubellus salinus TaxID=1364945 RepID=A0A9E7U7R1_9EURY|nr:zinc ribbon domain-containing protein [Salinirubellus salinus]UWM53836.1 zinc ribbon domain-containing protein [Salinirubellus salinus]